MQTVIPMSALTRSKPGNYVRFYVLHGVDGQYLTGLVIGVRSSTVLVGVQDKAKPWVLMGKKRVPNNSLWVVPFEAITETMVSPSGGL